MTKKPGFLYD